MVAAKNLAAHESQLRDVPGRWRAASRCAASALSTWRTRRRPRSRCPPNRKTQPHTYVYYCNSLESGKWRLATVLELTRRAIVTRRLSRVVLVLPRRAGFALGPAICGPILSGHARGRFCACRSIAAKAHCRHTDAGGIFLSSREGVPRASSPHARFCHLKGKSPTVARVQ